MNQADDRPAPQTSGGFFRSRTGIALLVLLAIAGYFLWTEHQAHVISALPWILLAACPLLHVFMHRGGHGGHHGSGPDGGAR
jgi:hypothetical protein